MFKWFNCVAKAGEMDLASAAILYKVVVDYMSLKSLDERILARSLFEV
jgi:hypothetical protein